MSSCDFWYAFDKTSPNKTSTIDGGIICPSVPAAATVPVAIFGSYPLLNIVGRDKSPIVTTVAPTIPVDAANKAPTIDTDIPKPPLIFWKTLSIFSKSSSATFDFSNIVPIKTNSGTAIRISFVIVPNILWGIAFKNCIGKTPK